MAAAGITTSHVHPFGPGGAAHGTVLATGAVVLTDLTPMARFGLKGRGSADWLSGAGLRLPDVNRVAKHRGMTVLRLGGDDILLLAQDAPDQLSDLKATWQAAQAPKGHSSWREEGWAWMRLSGPRIDDAMSRLCAVDLRHGKFGDDAVAQTRVGGLEAVAVRVPDGFDVLFDITASAYFARVVASVAAQCEKLPQE